ncbi:MAG: hypothetical protein K2L23_01900 [Odoribacter sp.]|nr:hypothetical protein [Odoribacter sp.]
MAIHPVEQRTIAVVRSGGTFYAPPEKRAGGFRRSSAYLEICFLADCTSYRVSLDGGSGVASV